MTDNLMWYPALQAEGMVFLDERAPVTLDAELPACCSRQRPESGWMQFECVSCGAFWTTRGPVNINSGKCESSSERVEGGG